MALIITNLKVPRNVGAGLDTGHGREEYSKHAEEVLIHLLTVPEVGVKVGCQCFR